MKRRFPVAPWLAGFRREWLRADVIAGLTAAAVVIPKAMAYAVIAGLLVVAGLYTSLAAMLVGGILIGARLFRLGFLANFISLPVLVGFEAGVGLVIIIGQLKSVLGSMSPATRSWAP